MMFFSVKLAVSIRATAKESSGCNRESANRMICSALLTCRLYEPEVSTSRYTPVLCGTVDEQALSSSAAPTKSRQFMAAPPAAIRPRWPVAAHAQPRTAPRSTRSEEHTSELQSQSNLVCRLLLE